MADFARQCSGGRRALERVRRAFEAVCRRRIVDRNATAVAPDHAPAAQPTVASMAGKQILRKVVDSCPHCGGELLFVEGVAHRALAVELDEKGEIYGVEFSDPKPVSYHRLTWIECDANCDGSRWEGMELFYFRE